MWASISCNEDHAISLLIENVSKMLAYVIMRTNVDYDDNAKRCSGMQSLLVYF